ncbi:MAG: hypothetical protein QOH25_2542 [Acidobacteriota bacterium]|jgi:hypothetical protein|nr:hypothetical protein [Acidobacteriota bacterium]
MAAGFKRRIFRAGGWRVARRIIKPIPVVGSLLAISLAGHEIRKKGWLRGAAHVGLDVTPVVGAAKGLVELFTGDLIPDKEPGRSSPKKRLPSR